MVFIKRFHCNHYLVPFLLASQLFVSPSCFLLLRAVLSVLRAAFPCHQLPPVATQSSKTLNKTRSVK